jgi:hypothetical protein
LLDRHAGRCRAAAAGDDETEAEMNAFTAERVGVERRIAGERRRTRLPEGAATSWSTLLRETCRVYASEMLSVGAVLALASLLILGLVLNGRWKRDRCIAALKEPNVNAAVLMAVCR